MAAKDNSDDLYKIRKRREEEDGENGSQDLASQDRTGKADSALKSIGNAGAVPNLQFDLQIREAQGLIEQLNTHYQRFFSKTEPRPPVEKRKRLDDLMRDLARVGAQQPALQYRLAGLRGTYQTQRERWDRLLKEREDQAQLVTRPRR